MSSTTTNKPSPAQTAAPSPAPPSPGPAVGSKANKAAAPKKPEEKTDHFRRAVVVGFVFIVLIALMVLAKGLFTTPREARQQQAHSPVAEQTGPQLSNYEQSLAAYRANRQREASAPTQATPQGQEAEQHPEQISQQDADYLRQSWRQPMAIKNRGNDGVQQGSTQVQPQNPQQRPVQVAQPSLPSDLPNPEDIANRYRAAQERLARLRALQSQYQQQQQPTPLTPRQPTGAP